MANFFSKLFMGSSDNDNEKDNKKKDFEIFKYDGVRAMRMGKFDYAEKCFIKALEIDNEFETLHYLTNLYTTTAAFEKAAETLNRMIEVDPEVVSTYISLAQVHYIMEKYDDMTAPCQKALELQPENEEAELLLAKSANKKGDIFQAIAFATKAIQKKEDYTDALLLRSEILGKMNQFKEALADIDAIMAYDPENESAAIAKAGLIGAQGDMQEAITLYNQVIATDPFNMEAYIGKANLYLNNNEADKAIEVLNDAIELSPDYAQAYKERGRAKLVAGDKEGATEDVKKALELNPLAADRINGEFNNKAAEFDNVIGIFK